MNNKGLIATIVAVGIGLGTLIVTLHVTTANAIAEVRQDLSSFRSDVHRDIAELRERMARLEGLFEGHIGGERDR